MLSYAVLSGVFRRYMQVNLMLRGKPCALCDPQGVPVGRLDQVTLVNAVLHVAGQCPDGEVTLTLGDMRTSTQVHTAQGQIGPDQIGLGRFSLSLPWPPDLHPTRARADGAIWLHVPMAEPLQLRLGHPALPWLRTSARFGVTMARLAPDLLAWLRFRDLGARTRLKAALGLSTPRPGGLLQDVLGGGADPVQPPRRPDCATIVLPVYNALDLLRDCLDHLVRHTDLPWHLVIIDDASTDPALRPWLRDWVANRPAGQVTLIESDTNRGFIGSVNAAFDVVLARPAAQTGPVVALNSDALVPDGWLSRLLAPMADDPRVASVTPFSNDAEIFSVPAICARVDLHPGQGGQIDRIARRLSAAHIHHPAPTGVGFCMAMARPFLDKVPRLDPAFGRGYGEEVDWCRKTAALGGRHLGHAGLFVEHRGGASFGTDEKRALIARNNAEISRRYPGYDRAVQDFLVADPLRSARMALALAWAGSAMSDPVPVYLGHSLGGGAEHWLEGRIARHTGQGHGAVVLRVGGAARWQLEVHGPAGSVTGWTEDFTLITRLLALLPACRIVYSCGVGDRDPVSLPAHLLALYRGAQDRIDVMMHDYFPISPSFTLLDSRGRYQGLPDPSDPAHQARRADGTLVSLQDWQNNWHALLSHAARLRCFSADSARLLTKAWPDLAPRIVLEPHDLTLAAPVTIPVRARPPACPLVAVLGNIAPHKGAGLVQQLARLSPQARGFDLMLLGNIDPAYPLPARFRVHGQYRPADIPRLAQHYGITHWLIPSLWPETFSFTTHEALATGLPTLAFDIGAQGDAVRQSANGVLLPYDPHGDLAGLVVHGVDWGSRS